MGKEGLGEDGEEMVEETWWLAEALKGIGRKTGL